MNGPGITSPGEHERGPRGSGGGKRIVISTFGSLGDIHPYMAIGLELQRRGHRAIIATSELYRAKVEGRGMGFHAVRPDVPRPEPGDEFFARLMDAERGSERLFTELMMPHLRDTYADLKSAVAGADMLISHVLTFSASALAEQTRIKWISTVLAPLSFFSLHDPPILSGIPATRLLRRLGAGPVKAFVQLAKRISSRWMTPYYRWREEVGLEKGEHPLFEGQHSPHRVLGLFSPLLGPPQTDWPAQAQATGFCFYDTRDMNRDGSVHHESTLPEALERFLQGGEPPIVFTLGSAAVFASGDFFEQSAQAIMQMKKRAVMLVGDIKNAPQIASPDILVLEYAPFSQLFPRAAAIVHQGGVGTTGQAMRAGVPMLVVPYSHDQPDNADRLVRLGIARALPRRKCQSHTVALELQRLLDDPEYSRRATAVGEQVRREDGVRAACDAIEDVLSD